jgi:hypothetical protein
VTVKLDMRGLNGAINAYRREFNISADRALRTQGRLLAEQLIKFTPPRNMAQGKVAVRRDIASTMRPLYKAKGANGRYFFFKNGKSYTVPKDSAPGTKVLAISNDGSLQQIDFEPTLGGHEVSFVHQARRGAWGRALKTQARVPAGVARNEYKAEMKKSEGMVGQARGGWAAGVIKFGGNVPAWIRKHLSAGRAVYNRHATRPSILLENFSQWAKHDQNTNRVLQNAIKSRIRDIAKAIRVAQRDATQRARMIRGIAK